MTILNFDKVLTEIGGDVILDEEKKAPISMKTIVVNAILAPEKEANGEESIKRFLLAQRIFIGGDVDLSPEEIVQVKKLVGKHPLPLVAGQVLEHIKKQTVAPLVGEKKEA